MWMFCADVSGAFISSVVVSVGCRDNDAATTTVFSRREGKRVE